jgi:hypothetical protein
VLDRAVRRTEPPGPARSGKLLAGVDRHGLLALFPAEGGEPGAVPGMPKGSVPVGWSRDGRLLVIPEAATHPVLTRVDVRTGQMEPITGLEPTDAVGVWWIKRVLLTRDERTVVFSYARSTS